MGWGTPAAAALRILILSLCFSAPSPAAQPAALHIKNFSQVNEHLYRGAQPTTVGLEELGAMGVKLVVSLCEQSETGEFEKDQLKKLGVKYVNIPFAPFSAPATEKVESVLRLLTSTDVPTFIHCRRGKDRTGTVVACYRIQHDGWDNRRALAEAKAHGMSNFERSMQSYILHFSPTSNSILQSAVR